MEGPSGEDAGICGRGDLLIRSIFLVSWSIISADIQKPAEEALQTAVSNDSIQVTFRVMLLCLSANAQLARQGLLIFILFLSSKNSIAASPE